MTTAFPSLAAVLLWLVPFAAGRSLRLGVPGPRRASLSAAAGISIAYVFIDLLPQMNRMQAIFSAASAGRDLPLPEYRVYNSALLGFVLFYVLENMVVVSRSQRRRNAEGEGSLAGWVHIAGFAGYGALMSYLLSAEAERTTLSLALYSVTMFLHFWIVDHSLRKEHGDFYDYLGRWAIASAVLAGWTVGMAGFSSHFIVPTLLGFVGGGVVINSIKEELPEKGEGRVWPFVFGAFGYALLLLIIEVAGSPNVE